MMEEGDRRIVFRDLSIGLLAIAVGAFLTAAGAAAEQWWLVTEVAVVTGVGLSAVDLTTADRWQLAIIGLIGAGGVFGGLWLALGGLSIGDVPILAIGFGAGVCCYRLLVGVLYPLPAARRQRENLA